MKIKKKKKKNRNKKELPMKIKKQKKEHKQNVYGILISTYWNCINFYFTSFFFSACSSDGLSKICNVVFYVFMWTFRNALWKVYFWGCNISVLNRLGGGQLREKRIVLLFRSTDQRNTVLPATVNGYLTRTVRWMNRFNKGQNSFKVLGYQ